MVVNNALERFVESTTQERKTAGPLRLLFCQLIDEMLLEATNCGVKMVTHHLDEGTMSVCA